jgi:hypothetical protein
MKKHYSMLVGVVALLVAGCSCHCFKGCGGPKVVGSGIAQTEQRDVGDFSEIKCKIGGDITVTRAEQATLRITADDNLLPIITTEVQDGALIVSAEESYSSKTRVCLQIEVPMISRVEVLGSADVLLDSVTDEKLAINICGSGDIEAVGEVLSLDVVINGSGELKLKQLQVQTCNIRINGSGDAVLSVAESLDAQINGSGDITYYGTPHVQVKMRGSGNLTKGN